MATVTINMVNYNELDAEAQKNAHRWIAEEMWKMILPDSETETIKNFIFKLGTMAGATYLEDGTPLTGKMVNALLALDKAS